MEPSSSPKLPYNPATDGFAAKAWECLRRNKAFQGYWRANLKLAKKGKRKFPSLPNPFALKAVYLLGFRDVPSAQLPSWLEFSDEDRDAMADSAYRADLPVTVDLQNLGEGPFSNDDLSFYLQPDSSIIVRIPKRILDSAHRDWVMKVLGELVPPTTNKGRWLKPQGGLLGSEKAWATYLCWEQLTSRGWPDSLAIDVAGHVTAKNVPENVSSLARLERPKTSDFRRMRELVARHSYTRSTASYIDGITAAIASVFPEFKPQYFRRH